jgi:hypothetical protein
LIHNFFLLLHCLGECQNLSWRLKGSARSFPTKQISQARVNKVSLYTEPIHVKIMSDVKNDIQDIGYDIKSSVNVASGKIKDQIKILKWRIRKKR